MLKDNDTYSTIPVSDVTQAKRFYGETLGLPVERDTDGGVMYRSGATRLFVYPSGYKAGRTHTDVVARDRHRVRGRSAQSERHPLRGVRPARPDTDRLSDGRSLDHGRHLQHVLRR